MVEIGLKYLGKKAPFTLSPAYLTESVQVNKEDDQILWFEDNIALRLMKDNPRMFEKVGERGSESDAISVPSAEEIEEDKFDSMTKRQIEAYARENYEIELDMRHNRDTLIEQIRNLEETTKFKEPE